MDFQKAFDETPTVQVSVVCRGTGLFIESVVVQGAGVERIVFLWRSGLVAGVLHVWWNTLWGG